MNGATSSGVVDPQDRLAGIEPIRELLRDRAGLAFTDDRQAATGIERAMKRAGLADRAAYLELVRRRAGRFDELLDELTVAETYFFREPRHFELIRRRVLPEIRRRRARTHVPRIWSAGCASGEEAYSLAIVLREEGLAGAQILATDISRAALDRARRAVYGSWSLRGQDRSEWIRRYFACKDGCYSLAPWVRERVRFDQHNLAGGSYPSSATGICGMDLILCRNVLIYFDSKTVGEVALRLYRTLADGGWLITGPSDPPLAKYAPLATVVTDEGVVYRRLPQSDQHRDAGVAKAVAAVRRGSDSPRARPVDSLVAARVALARGELQRIVARRRELVATAAGSALYLRALARLAGGRAALRETAVLVPRHPLASELRLLQATLLMDLGRDAEAIEAARRALYLDSSLAIAHYILGCVLHRRGDVCGARRAYRNARDLCCALPVDELLPLADGEPAGRLAKAARTRIELLDAAG